MTGPTKHRTDNHITVAECLRLFKTVDLRNETLGWERYDWADLDSHPWILGSRGAWFHGGLRFLIRGLDLVFPLAIHGLLRVKKRIVPTSYVHVGMACLLYEESNAEPPGWGEDRVLAIADQLLSLRLPAEHLCWSHPYPHHGGGWKAEGPEVPVSCAHHTSRAGAFLARAGIRRGREDLVALGASAANALMVYHNWDEYEDGTCTVSYYPSTRDQTINTAADVAILFAELPESYRSREMSARLDGITRMVLAEQAADGSWEYCTARHYAETGDVPFIDNHHTAQVLQALGRILSSRVLDPGLAAQVAEALESGLCFYLAHFFNDRGEGFYFPDGTGKAAAITGYSEGLAAIYWAIEAGTLTPDLRSKSRVMARRIATASCDLLNRHTRDVACQKIFGHNYHIQSLRWGSGPFLEGLAYALNIGMEDRS